MKTNIQVCREPDECFCDRCCLKIVNDNLCNYISKSSLPPLPTGWHGPWEAEGEYIVDKNGHIIAHVYDYGHRTPEFIAALLNVTHPSPAKECE